MFMTRMIGSIVLLVCTAAAFTLSIPAKPAQACNILLKARRSAVIPRDGMQDVPTNAQIRIKYFPIFTNDLLEVLRNPIIRPKGGESIEATIEVVLESGAPVSDLQHWSPWEETWIIVQPREELAPNTTYEILDRFESSCHHRQCIRENHAVVASFTTGDGPDEHPPTMTEITEITTAQHPATSGIACGSDFPYLSARLQWMPADDDGGQEQVQYHVYQDDSLMRAFIGSPVYEEPLGVCPTSIPGQPVQQQLVHFRLAAVDLAGNQSTIEHDIVVQCPEEDKALKGEDR